MKTLLTIIAVLALAVPAAFAVPPDGKGKPESPGKSAAAPGQSAEKNAAKKCKAERKAIGVEAFRQKYGKNANGANALGKCVSAAVKHDDQVEHARENAAKKCKAERAAMGVEAFKQKYGKNANGANALGKCVSAAVKKSY